MSDDKGKAFDVEELLRIAGMEDLLVAKTARHIHPPDLTPCMCTNTNRVSLPIPLLDEKDESA